MTVAPRTTVSKSVRAIVEDLLAESDALLPEAARLVRAAFAGQLDVALADEAIGASFDAPPPEDAEPAGAWLTGIAVQGFRGVGPRAELELQPGPGLTMVVGRNGTGKSSFAEGLELALTGKNSRWEDKHSSVWKEGWRNLHHEGPSSVEARFAIDGLVGEALVSLRWPNANADLSGGVLETEMAGQRAGGLGTLGWEGALEGHRPLLAHSHLSRLLERRPLDLYKSMADGLGLEDIDEASMRLHDQFLADNKVCKEARDALGNFHPDLDALDDERASTSASALAQEPWDLDVVERVLSGSGDGEEDQPLDILRRLVTLDAPDNEMVDSIRAQLAEAHTKLTAIAGSDAARAERLLKALTDVLAIHEHDGDQTCPVCGTGAIDATWAGAARERQAQLRQEAHEAQAAHKARMDALDAAQQICVSVPNVLDQAEGVGVDASAAIVAWQNWASAPDGEPSLPDLAERLTIQSEALRAAVEELRERARIELERRHDLWRPLSDRLGEWLPLAHAAQKAEERRSIVKAADDWVKNVADEMLASRFRPVAEQAQHYWELMRQRSSVSLQEIALRGKGNRRSLGLAVTVDGEQGAALSVMSQGELNAFSLSLFLARATLPESPFRFLVIDDPVQAMDPDKVDGLAHVLEEVALKRQVVVFTHDARLPDAIRHLGATDLREITVGRDEKSLVTCRRSGGPVWRHLSDAYAILRTDGLAEETRRRTVPGFCRLALEAACVQGIRRKRAAAGVSHEQTEADILQAGMLNDKIGLILFDETGHGSDALDAVNDQFGNKARDVVTICNRGSHAPSPSTDPLFHEGSEVSDLESLMKETDRLASKLRKR